MSVLFQPFRLGPIEIRNRFMRSATTSAWADEHGVIRPEITSLYGRLAEGGVGLIVKGHLYVTEAGKAHAGMAGLSGNAHIPKLRELTAAVHRHGAKILAQLNHAGYYSLKDPAGPSEYRIGRRQARAMNTNEIRTVVNGFGDAATRAAEAGFDGVQFHAAHGYLISQFLSRRANLRKDEWGGSLTNRMRLLREIYLETRSRLGPGLPISAKMNSDDFSRNGFTVRDAARVAKTMAAQGIDLIEVSGGGIGRRRNYRNRARSSDPEFSEASYAGHAVRIKAAARPAPIALVHGIRSLRTMQAIVQKQVADVISLSRPFIREPDLVQRLQRGEEEVTCTRCDACRRPKVFSKMMLRCHLD